MTELAGQLAPSAKSLVSISIDGSIHFGDPVFFDNYDEATGPLLKRRK